jgi:hypothetical protein
MECSNPILESCIADTRTQSCPNYTNSSAGSVKFFLAGYLSRQKACDDKRMNATSVRLMEIQQVRTDLLSELRSGIDSIFIRRVY